MFSTATQPRPPPRHNFVVSAITFEGFKLRSSNLTHALFIQISWTSSITDIVVQSKMAAGGHFVQKFQKKKKLRIDLKWQELWSKVIFGHPKWPPPAILSKILKKHVFPPSPTFPYFSLLFPTFHNFSHLSPLFPTFPTFPHFSSLLPTFSKFSPLFTTFHHFPTFPLFPTFSNFSPLFPTFFNFFQLPQLSPHFFQLFTTFHHFALLFPTFPTFSHF